MDAKRIKLETDYSWTCKSVRHGMPHTFGSPIVNLYIKWSTVKHLTKRKVQQFRKRNKDIENRTIYNNTSDMQI